MNRALVLMASPTWQFNRMATTYWPGKRHEWFVNERKPEYETVPSDPTGPHNFAYTKNWTGRSVRPFVCFNPLERK